MRTLIAYGTIEQSGVEMRQTEARSQCLGNGALARSGGAIDGDNHARTLRSFSALASPQIAMAAQKPSRTRLGQLVWTSSDTVSKRRTDEIGAVQNKRVRLVAPGQIGVGGDDAGHADEADGGVDVEGISHAVVRSIRSMKFGKLVAMGSMLSSATPCVLASPATAMLIAMR